jgi:hypothetical protein
LIIRHAVACETCDQPHTVRIGLGQDDSQTHRFSCRGCGEEMAISLNGGPDTAKRGIFYDENCKQIREVTGAPIVNLDANFLIPEDEQGQDFAFPRLKQMHAMFEKASERDHPQSPYSSLSNEKVGQPRHSANYAEEWKLLKKAWSLYRNNKVKLSKRCVDGASRDFYSYDPLDNLPDWVWRFTFFLCQPSFEKKFLDAMKPIESLIETNQLNDFSSYYKETLAGRGSRYFSLMKDYFSAYSEYGQVHFLVTNDIEIPITHQASSSDFQKIKMFYGNAFEAFTSNVDLFALMNNILHGRAFDTFESLTLVKYKKLDKASRFGPFSMNPFFTEVCIEADNQIRNASHHGSFEFDQHANIIRYRHGKGGTGPEETITYSRYLEKCVRLFLQAMTLYRVELILCKKLNIPYPL